MRNLHLALHLHAIGNSGSILDPEGGGARLLTSYGVQTGTSALDPGNRAGHHPCMAKDSAAGPLGGYIWQYQLGLLRLIEMDAGQTLAIEKHDDLSVLTAERVVIVLEQDKHSLNGGALTVRSAAFWDALGLWADKADEYPFWPTLRLASNRTVSDELACLLPEQRLARAHEQLEALCDVLDAVAEEGRNQSLAGRFSSWKSLSDRSDRLELLRFVELIEEVRLSSLSKAIEEALGRGGVPVAKQTEFRERLEGWFQDEVRSLLTSTGLKIPASRQKAQLYFLFQTCSSVDLHFAHASTDVSADELIAAGESTRMYQRQLELVEANNDIRRDAVEFYHRARKERAHLLDEDLIGMGAIADHEDELANQWKVARSAASMQDDDEVARGRATLLDCFRGSSEFGGNRAPTHIHVGTLHIMADVPKIGWHPRYQALLSEDDDG